ADDAIGFELFEDPNIPIETKEMIRLNDTFEFEIDFNFKSAQLHNSYMHGELSNKYLYIKGIKGYDKYALSYYMFTIEDRTTEKQLEAAFSNKNEQLSRAMEVGEVAVWDWKLDTNDVFISENFYDWFDTDYHFLEEQFMTILDYVHPQEQLQVSEQFRKTIQNQENNLEVVFRLRKNQNAYVWVRMLGEAVYADNNLYRFTGIFLNIDIRKRASDSLTEKDRSMNILLDNMETAFAVHDMVYDESGDAIDYRFVYVNRAYEELLGVKKEHMVGHTMAGLYPNFEKRVIQAYGNVARYGQSFRFSDYIGLRQRYCDAIVYQTKRDQFAVLYNDITEKRLIEEALKQTEKMSALGQLAGGIAHDFNNQLMIMSSFCQLLMDMELSNVEKGYIDKIYNATTHSKEIIKELLAFSKKGSANYITINFNHLVERVIQIMRFTFDKNITITSELVSLTANVYGDESLLENALINLCINAKDALNSSGSNNNYIKINTQNMMINEPKHLVIDVLQPGHYVVVKISDNGMGIKPENINKIFEPFFTTKDQRGTGMGLAAVFGTVKRHSGGIDIQSVFGEGTVVSVYIPVSDEVIEESKHSLHNVSETKKEREILIIDDEPIICEVLKEYFSAKKYKVHTANMPSKGLEIYREIHDQIEVVLLDVIMPEMNGFEVLSELITINNSTRAIILSGYREDISLSKEVES
nr:ATP-binding protein [Vallitaleaceae bacterium]